VSGKVVLIIMRVTYTFILIIPRLGYLLQMTTYAYVPVRRNYKPVFPLFVTYHWMCHKSNTTVHVTSGARTPHLFRSTYLHHSI